MNSRLITYNENQIINTESREDVLFFLVKYLVKYPSLADVEGVRSVVKEVYESATKGKYGCLTAKDIQEVKSYPRYFINGLNSHRYNFNSDGLLEYKSVK